MKMGHPKRKFIFQPLIFSGYLSFREDNVNRAAFFGGKVTLKYP